MALPLRTNEVAPPVVDNPGLLSELLFNTLIIYGPTGSRKTSQIREFAKYTYEKTGKITRLISMDGGGWATAQDMVNAGVIEVWRLVDEEKLLSAVHAASKGAWPKNLKNGIRGPGLIFVPARDKKEESLREVGAYAIEGLLSIASAVMRTLVHDGRKISEDVVSKFTEESDFGQFSFGAPAKAHFGFVQNFVLDIIRNFSSLPGLDRVLFSSLEGKGEDRLTKALQYGPAVAGSAITAAVPQYVGDCLHFEDFIEEAGIDPNNPKQKLQRPRVRAWFTQHPDPQTGVLWPAKSRLIPSKIAEFKKRIGPNGYFVLPDADTPKVEDIHLGTYLRVQDELLASGSSEAREWKAKVDEARNKLKEGK